MYNLQHELRVQLRRRQSATRSRSQSIVEMPMQVFEGRRIA